MRPMLCVHLIAELAKATIKALYWTMHRLLDICQFEKRKYSAYLCMHSLSAATCQCNPANPFHCALIAAAKRARHSNYETQKSR